MRLYNYINEEVKVENYFPFLKKKCSMAINTMKKSRKGMWRGVASAFYDDDFIRKKVRQERKPKDSFGPNSKILDQYLDTRFGWKPRSQGLFVIGNVDVAGTYGKEYLVFPVGNFKYVWNKKRADFLPYIGSRNKPENIPSKEDLIFKIENEMENFTDKDIVGGLREYHEIMIKTPEYYGIAKTWIKKNYELFEELGIDLKGWYEL